MIVLEASSFLEDHPIQLFFVLVYLALSFAALWRQGGRRGPAGGRGHVGLRTLRRMVESHSRTNRIQQPQATPPLEKARASLVCPVTAVAFRSPRHPFLGPVQINFGRRPGILPMGADRYTCRSCNLPTGSIGLAPLASCAIL